MKKVTLFQANDGTLFETEEGAKEHEADRVVRQGLYDLLDEMGLGSVQTSEVTDHLMENLDKLRKIVSPPQP